MVLQMILFQLIFSGLSPAYFFHGDHPSGEPEKRNMEVLAGSAVTNCDANHQSFAHREKATYKMYYNWNFVWVPAGEVTFQVEESATHYYYKAEGKSYPSYDWFFKVHDIYESKVRKTDLKPVWSRRQVAEGNYRLYHEHWMNHEAGTAESLRGKTKETAKLKTVPIEDCFQDVLSVIYFLRNSGIHEYKKGEKLPVNLFIDDSVYQVRVKYMGKDGRKNIRGLGKLEVQRVIPELVAGDVFKEGDQMQVWVSNDNNRLPVLIESPIMVGSVKAVLIDYENLLEPLAVR